jgi:hypothetical protein
MSTKCWHTIYVLLCDYDRMELAHMQFVGTRGNKLATTFSTSMGRLHESISVHSSRMFSKSLHSSEATPTNMTGKILLVRMNTRVRWVMEILIHGCKISFCNEQEYILLYHYNKSLHGVGPSNIGHNFGKK